MSRPPPSLGAQQAAQATTPPEKKLRATLDLEAPGPMNYEDIWTSCSTSEENLKTPGTLFGSQRSWFVRASYVSLYNDVMADNERLTQIVNGTAGIGKSSFLLYILGRCRCAGKPVVLHYHRNAEQPAVAVFFPVNGKPISITATSQDYWKTFREWYDVIGKEESLFLVDGIVSFIKDDVQGVKYVAAKSPSCSIGFMEKDQNRRDRWLDFWSGPELLAYAQAVGIPNAEEIIEGNLFHIGAVCRYAFVRDAARDAVLNAISRFGAKDLLKVVDTGLMGKYDQQKVVDRLIHRHPPPDGTGVFGTKYTFASEFVATRVAMALSLETQIQTQELIRSLAGVGAAGSMRGVLFEAYAARQLTDGRSFAVKEIGTGNESQLVLPQTTILQKDTKTLNKTNYSVQEISGKIVWPNPAYNMPAIDVFMLFHQACIAFQMTVSTSHGLDIKGTKAFLRYFDSVSREVSPGGAVPQQYAVYFAVPTDIYEKFSSNTQPMTGANGATLTTKEAVDTSLRLKQWILRIE